MRRTEAPIDLRTDAPAAGQTRPSHKFARRFGLFLLTLFVVAGISAIVYLMLIVLPTQYRRQAARLIVPTVQAAQVDDSVFFGAYEQDNDKSDGTEPIEWIVLEKQDDRSMLISRYALDCVRFNEAEAFATWDQSTILTWLNNTFYYDAFTSAERTMLLATSQLTDTNPYFDTYAGSVTTEKIFLMNIAQVANFFPTEESRQCVATAYTTERGALTDESTHTCIWWLRSPGFDASAAARVLMDGRINYCGYRVQSNRMAVRPCVWVSFDPENRISED